MNKDRDMFYNVYGYGGANPAINPIQGMVPGQMNPFMNHNELNTRLSNLENKIKVLESQGWKIHTILITMNQILTCICYDSFALPRGSVFSTSKDCLALP